MAHKIEVRKKTSKRVSTRKIPCTKYEYNTCKSIEENILVLKNFNCQIPILYHGHHLDHLFKNETSICNDEITRKAINLIMDTESNCTKIHTCQHTRYSSIYR